MEVHQHIPYRYQEEVFLRAQKENIIAALSTGSGKTLISILLIKWIAAQEKSQGKAIIFLVPKVPLVEQQKENIEKQTSLNVGKLHGSMELELSNRTGWKKMFERHDVFVMTAQIFLNLITHGLWSIKKVSLMIFDECHYARKNHPYNGILREYFQVAPSEQPKIFGMTASPIWNVRNPLGSIMELEGNMNAKVVGVRENVVELHDKTPKPEERVAIYDHPPEEYDYPLPTIHQCLMIIDRSIWDELEIPYSLLDIRYAVTFTNIGPYGASLFLYQEIRHHIEGILLEYRRKDLDYVHDFDDMIVVDNGPSSCKSLPKDIDLILEILEDFKSFFPSKMTSYDIPIPISLDWCTPKVKALVDILLEFYAKSSTFQAIIFVEQRQIASALSKILPFIPELQGKVKTAFLVGQGVNKEGVSKESDRFHGDPVKLFRDGHINILIATSVAEEGLDFKECDLVVRFDDLHHMVAYVQSRGRARKRASTFVIMGQKGQDEQLARYLLLKAKEEEVTEVYRNRHPKFLGEQDVDDDVGEEEYSADLVDRERYVEQSTGAVLTYDNSRHLLSYLCSLIPRDAFTAIPKPKYTGEFQATLYLPRALPLAPQDLVYEGPPKRSTKEARRAVAFMAVRRLRELNVFDEYLLPISKDLEEDNAPFLQKFVGKHIRHDVPIVMSIPVKDPWCIGPSLWLHPVFIDGHPVAGLISGTMLPLVGTVFSCSRVHILPGELLRFDEDSELEQRRAMEEFTKIGIYYNVTASPLSSPLSLYLVPITTDHFPDFKAIDCLLANPRGNDDWSHVSEDDYNRLIVVCRNTHGSVNILRRIRRDITPMSSPPPGSREAKDSTTYHEYWVKKWSKKSRQAVVPTDGPILETFRLLRSNMGADTLEPPERDLLPVHTASDGRLLPLDNSVWLAISNDVRRAFEVLPVICRRITDVYRARCARFELNLPLIPDNLVTEAFTIPSAALSYSNQRLETLGDAVLQVCTTVHLLNAFPSRHEGQLTKLRQKTVSNRYLLQRALDVGIERYINCETSSVYKWRYVLDGKDMTEPQTEDSAKRFANREYPRRSLQDCMEAILGASFLTGGIPMALQAGTALGLEFGGPLPWFMRYSQTTAPVPVSPLFSSLEGKLGYKFRHNHLVLEALTHPSFATPTEGPSYQRLEFLGDAILDLVVAKYMYDKYPTATSHQLSFPRTRGICASTLAHIAVNRLGLHKMMLFNSLDLNAAIDRYVPVLESLSAENVVKRGWRYDPPKALSDVFESLMGAVLVDTGYDYEKTAGVMEYVMEDILEVLSPDLAKDPVSELLEWAAGLGCTCVVFEKHMTKIKPLEEEREGIVVVVHGTHVAGPIVATSIPVARGAAAERAITTLKNPESDKCLQRLCTCNAAMQVDKLTPSSDSEDAEEVVILLTENMEMAMEI